MPEHTTFFSYLIASLGLGKHFDGPSLLFHEKMHGVAAAEPIVASLFVVLLILGLAAIARGQIVNYDKSVLPDENLSVRTFFELLIGYFYDLMKDMMGPAKAKRFFPVIGTCACFILFSNFLGFIPGFSPPTSSWSVTAGCAIVVAVLYNFYGIKENGLGYIKHLFGPSLPLAIIIFPIELLTVLLLRPATLSIRLMLNMTVDHILVSVMLSMFALFLPLPIMVLGTLVAIVQVLVFCLLSSVYIALATEHEEHGDGHGHAKSGQAHSH